MSFGFEVMDHVADVRIRVWGACLGQVFCEASKGMWSLIFGERNVPALSKRHINVKGVDIEDLFIEFLNEQLAFFDIEGLAVSRTENIMIDKAPDTGHFILEAVVYGALVSEISIRPELHIKAATFHELRLTPTEAWVTFDV